MDFKTPLAKVRGLGASHSGSSHWWMQRITAIALIPLSLWIVSYLKLLSSATYEQILVWLNEPLNSLFAILWIIAAFYHAALGVQVVIEDYVHTESVKITAVWVIKLSCFVLAVTTIIAFFRIMIIG